MATNWAKQGREAIRKENEKKTNRQKAAMQILDTMNRASTGAMPSETEINKAIEMAKEHSFTELPHLLELKKEVGKGNVTKKEPNRRASSSSKKPTSGKGNCKPGQNPGRDHCKKREKSMPLKTKRKAIKSALVSRRKASETPADWKRATQEGKEACMRLGGANAPYNSPTGANPYEGHMGVCWAAGYDTCRTGKHPGIMGPKYTTSGTNKWKSLDPVKALHQIADEYNVSFDTVFSQYHKHILIQQQGRIPDAMEAVIKQLESSKPSLEMRVKNLWGDRTQTKVMDTGVAMAAWLATTLGLLRIGVPQAITKWGIDKFRKLFSSGVDPKNAAKVIRGWDVDPDDIHY